LQKRKEELNYLLMKVLLECLTFLTFLDHKRTLNNEECGNNRVERHQKISKTFRGGEEK